MPKKAGLKFYRVVVGAVDATFQGIAKNQEDYLNQQRNRGDMQIQTELTQWQQDKLYHFLRRWDDLSPYLQAIYERAPVEAPYFDGHWFDNGGTWRLFGGDWLASP
jgi:hypothetical protein